MTPDEFVRDYGNYRSNEMNPYGKIGKALQGWRDADRRLAEIAQIIGTQPIVELEGFDVRAAIDRMYRLAKGTAE